MGSEAVALFDVNRTLNRIAEGVEFIATAMVSKDLNEISDQTTIKQLLGNTIGFRDALKECIDEMDGFKRANKLRNLLDRTEKIASSYEAALLESRDGQGEVGQRSEVPQSS